jgi:FAD-dependent oxidoreductase domain-containing protein 1
MGRGYDVLIIGGGVIGGSIAYHLLNDGFDGTVALLEKDPSYEFAGTTRSAGGIRQQFSTEVNIRIGLYGLQAFRRFDEEMAVDGEPAHAEFRERGYLFLADERNWAVLQRLRAVQSAVGAQVELLSPDQVARIFPHLDCERIAGGSWGPQAGYMDPHGVLHGYLRKARALGAAYLHAECSAVLLHGGRAAGVRTVAGEVIEGRNVVIAAGAWAGSLGVASGIELPIDPIPRMVYWFDPAEKFDYDLPLVIAPDGLWLRHEAAKQIITGRSRPENPAICFDWDREYFMEDLWPRLAHWVPSLERLKLQRGWTGLYAMSRHDQNALVGPYPGVEGLFVAGGFSGHGLQQSPAVGKGLSEMIRLGRYETIDLGPLSIERLITGQKVLEEEVV